MMGLYQLKEFLTLDDVADYLRDKGVYDFDLTNNHDQIKLLEYLKSLIMECKIQPVFYFMGEFTKCIYTACDDDNLTEKDINNGQFKRYYSIVSDEFIASLLKTPDTMQAIYMDFCTAYKPNIVFQCSKIMLADWSFDDNSEHICFYDIVYPRNELDALFNAKDDSQQQIADLQAENARLKAHITQLESQLNQANITPANDDIELTGTSKKAVTKLLYALLREHNYSIDGTIKGATNQALENLTTRHHVPIARQTIASWLTEINTLHHNKNK